MPGRFSYLAGGLLLFAVVGCGEDGPKDLPKAVKGEGASAAPQQAPVNMQEGGTAAPADAKGGGTSAPSGRD